MKSGKIELDGGVLAGVDAVGGSVAVDVDDHVDVQASNSEASLEVVPWTDLIWIRGRLGLGSRLMLKRLFLWILSLRFKVGLILNKKVSRILKLNSCSSERAWFRRW